MKVIIAGGRDYHDYETVCQAVANSGFFIDTVISGGATGVDTLAVRYALENDIPLETYPADWATHGKAAGPIRNRKMAEVAEGLIAIWDGQSPGTKNMIDTAMKHNLVIFVLRLDVLTADTGLALFMDDDKDYELGTLEQGEEFAKKRNYEYKG